MSRVMQGVSLVALALASGPAGAQVIPVCGHGPAAEGCGQPQQVCLVLQPSHKHCNVKEFFHGVFGLRDCKSHGCKSSCAPTCAPACAPTCAPAPACIPVKVVMYKPVCQTIAKPVCQPTCQTSCQPACQPNYGCGSHLKFDRFKCHKTGCYILCLNNNACGTAPAPIYQSAPAAPAQLPPSAQAIPPAAAAPAGVPASHPLADLANAIRAAQERDARALRELIENRQATLSVVRALQSSDANTVDQFEKLLGQMKGNPAQTPAVAPTAQPTFVPPVSAIPVPMERSRTSQPADGLQAPADRVSLRQVEDLVRDLKAQTGRPITPGIVLTNVTR